MTLLSAPTKGFAGIGQGKRQGVDPGTLTMSGNPADPLFWRANAAMTEKNARATVPSGRSRMAKPRSLTMTSLDDWKLG